MSVSALVTERLHEQAHNFLGYANSKANNFTAILGTVNLVALNGLLSDFFAKTNEGKWTPEFIEILKTCVKSETYSQVLKDYVKDSLTSTVSSPFSK
jgi:hypothetical protein